METTTKKEVYKSHNHDHFWIEDGTLFETYKTIRGLRWREKFEVKDMPDVERCTEECMKYIAETYL